MKKKTLPQTVTIRRNETEPEAMELVAEALIKVADGIDQMRKHATDRLIVVILHDLTGVGKPAIRALLSAAPKIRAEYLR